jgi:hypothetical protein
MRTIIGLLSALVATGFALLVVAGELASPRLALVGLALFMGGTLACLAYLIHSNDSRLVGGMSTERIRNPVFRRHLRRTVQSRALDIPSTGRAETRHRSPTQSTLDDIWIRPRSRLRHRGRHPASMRK